MPLIDKWQIVNAKIYAFISSSTSVLKWQTCEIVFYVLPFASTFVVFIELTVLMTEISSERRKKKPDRMTWLNGNVCMCVLKFVYAFMRSQERVYLQNIAIPLHCKQRRKWRRRRKKIVSYELETPSTIGLLILFFCSFSLVYMYGMELNVCK